jgi:hypothetical protein
MKLHGLRLAFLPLVFLPAVSLAAGRPLCQGLLVVGDKGSSGTRLSASKNGDVTLRIETAAELPGDHLLEFRLFDPKNALYQSISVPTGDAPGSRMIPSYPRPVRIVVPVMQPSQASQKSFRVDQVFPLGGTMIQTNSLYGNWRLEALLDGLPYCAPFSFTISR